MSNDPITRLNAALSGRYRIERELGEGGMATVYLAADLKHERKVALKVLKPELAAVVGAERFLAEIKTTANLQHPHILPLHDSGEADSFLFYVMPYIDGETLRDRLDREKQLPVDEAVRIATDVAEALHSAHEQGVIHRDIKPANILLSKGRPVVSDFGIALAVGAAGGGRLTETGLSLGTPHYMSPEQATGDQSVGAATDVYALGCVLYEMLVGEPPYTGSTAQAILGKIIAGEAATATKYRASVPANVDAAIRKALAKLPADRFTGAQDFARALGNPHYATARGAATIGGATVARAAESGWRSRPTQIAMAMAVAATVAAVWGWAQVGPSLIEEVQYLPIALDQPYRVRQPWSHTVLLSPNGRQVLYRGLDDVGRRGGLEVLDLGTGQTTPVVAQSSGPLAFAFSPSGDSVVFRQGAQLGRYYTASLATGQMRMVTDSSRNTLPSWSDDGWIYYPNWDWGISRVRSDGTRRELVAQPDPGAEPWMAGPIEALPNGKGVLYGRRAWQVFDMARSEIWAVDLETGAQHQIVRGVEARYALSGHLVVAQADGSLLAAPFDVGSLTATGAFVEVLDGVEVNHTDGGGASFSLSDDGDLLYVGAAALGEDAMVFVSRTGQEQREVGGWGGWIYDYPDAAVAVSDDGSTQVASVFRGYRIPTLWLRRAGQEQPSQLTSPGRLDASPQFINADQEVAFAGPFGAYPNWDLHTVPLDGSRERAVALDRAGDIISFDFAGDARSVVFCEVDTNGDSDLLVHQFAPDTLTRVLVATPFNECSPTLSPSEQWVAYTSNESGRSEVYVRSVRGGGPARRISSVGADQPRWSHDGRELYFRGIDGGVFAVPVSEGATFSFGGPELLFEAGDLQWTGLTTADDQSFIMLKQNLHAPGRVVLIRSFAKVLQETDRTSQRGSMDSGS